MLKEGVEGHFWCGVSCRAASEEEKGRADQRKSTQRRTLLLAQAREKEREREHQLTIPHILRVNELILPPSLHLFHPFRSWSSRRPSSLLDLPRRRTVLASPPLFDQVSDENGTLGHHCSTCHRMAEGRRRRCLAAAPSSSAEPHPPALCCPQSTSSAPLPMIASPSPSFPILYLSPSHSKLPPTPPSEPSDESTESGSKSRLFANASNTKEERRRE